MQGFRFILVAVVITGLLCAGHAVSTPQRPSEAQSKSEYDALTAGELYRQLFGESVTDAKRLLASLETGSALHRPQRIRTDPFMSMIPARQVAQRALASPKSSRPTPRRTRPAPRTSSRPKSITQRTRQVGKEARTRSRQRLNANKTRAKQRIKRTSVFARRNGNIARKRPPLVQARKTSRAPATAREASTKRSPATPNRKKPRAKGK